MRQLMPWFFAAALAARPPGAVWAQVPAPLHLPGLREYVTQVLQRNAGLAAARTDITAASKRITPGGALPDPVLSLGAVNAPVPSFDLRQQDMSMLAIRLEQMLPFPGKQGAAAGVAREEHRAAEAEAGAVEAALAADAASAYFDLAYAQSALTVWRRRLQLAEQAVRVAMTRYSTGMAPQAEVLRAQVRRARVREDGHSFAADVERADAAADALRGGPGDSLQVPALVGPDSTLLLTVLRDTLPDWTSLRDGLMRANPALTLAGARVERARASAHAFGIAARPDFMVMAEYAPRLGGRDPLVTGMIGVSIPLWNGRKQGPAAEAARWDLTGAEQRQQDLQARLEAELRDRLARLRALQLRVAALRTEVLPLAEAASASALASYSVGKVDLTAVLDAQDEFFEAQHDLARLIATYGTERAALSALLGEEWYQ